MNPLTIANMAGATTSINTCTVPVPGTRIPNPPSTVEFEPPVACVRRILKKTLPPSSNVGKDAVAAFARASGIFIIYLTACANDFARENRRQTITANDVLAAVKELEFDEFSPELNSFLESYRETEKNKKDAKAKAAAARAKEEKDDIKTNESAADVDGDAATHTIALPSGSTGAVDQISAIETKINTSKDDTVDVDTNDDEVDIDAYSNDGAIKDRNGDTDEDVSMDQDGEDDDSKIDSSTNATEDNTDGQN